MRFHGQIVAAPVALLLGLAALADETGAQRDRTAVPLRTPAFTAPVETAGTGLAPELTVRITVDERGRVDDVRILKINPSTEHDPDFEAATRETLSDWHYAPEILDGKPIRTQLEWTIQFQAREQPRREAHDTTGIWSGLLEEDRSESMRRKVLAMPLERKIKMLEGLAESAEASLDRSNRSDYRSPHFVVVTDAPSKGTAETVAGNLEAVYGVLYDMLRTKIDPQPDAYKVVAYVYASRAGYQSLRRACLGYEFGTGFYHAAGLLAFHLEMPSNESLMSTMLHEATHAFFDRHILRPGIRLPRWFGEGLAEYIGNSAIRKKKLVPGKTPKSQIYQLPDRMVMGRSQHRLHVDKTKQAAKEGKTPTLDEILSANRNTFYGDRADMFYTLAWMLIHYLRHGESGWADEEFPAFVLYVAEGYPAVEALEAVYGKPLEQLEADFQTYIKKF